jgi:hypothetical protein
MNTDAKSKKALLIRVARDPTVRAVVRCALMCALGAKSHDRRAIERKSCGS